MTSQIAPRYLPTLPGWVLTGLMGAAAIAVLAISRVVTVTAGWMKIFSADPRLGFQSAADFHAKLSSGSTPAQIDAWQHEIFNSQVNADVTGTFLVLLSTIVAACGRGWWELLAARKSRPLREEPYVALLAA